MFQFSVSSSIHPLRRYAPRLFEPYVKLESLTLIRHKMTFSHFSKGLIRPVSGGKEGLQKKHWMCFCAL